MKTKGLEYNNQSIIIIIGQTKRNLRHQSKLFELAVVCFCFFSGDFKWLGEREPFLTVD
jgi:hypothetical protein